MNLRRLLLFLIAGSLLTINTTRCDAQALHFTNGRKSKTFTFRYIKNLIIIPLTINGKGPFNFVLDTGLGITLITDPSLSDSLKLKNLRTLKVTGFGEGQELSAYVAPSLFIDIGSNISGEVSAAILKNDAFNLSAFTGIPVHGLIGYEFFSSFIVKINYSTNTLRLYSHSSLYVPKRGIKIPISIEDRKPYLNAVISDSLTRQSLVKLIIDTGAGHPISLETDYGIPYKVPKPNIRANLGVGLNGMINGYIARIQYVTLGKYKLNNVIAAFPDFKDAAGKLASLNRNGNIGNNILKRFSVVFDYNNQCIYMNPNSSFKEPFEHDMSGLDLGWGGPSYQRLFVSQVEEGSAAEEAGLQINDEIIDINLRPVSEMGTEEIYAMLRSGNNRNLMLRIRSADSDKLKAVIVTLKRRI